jgi:alpha-L-fucosidase
MNRRKFIENLSILSASPLAFTSISCKRKAEAPGFLHEHSNLFNINPRAASLEWFKKAKYGLFMHFGLYSIIGEGEWIQFNKKISVAEYAELMKRFNANKFDPDFITDLALEAGMKYINLTSKHHDGFALWPTRQNDYHVMNTPTKRDLIGELSEACNEKGLGLFLYYSYAADWKHPYFYPRESGWAGARPDYSIPQPAYKFKQDEDFQKYIEFVHAQLNELLQYQPLAGIWFDPIMGYYHRPDLFPIDETYEIIRKAHPHMLISFKQGANGEEDFMAPERHGGAKVGEQFEVAKKAYQKNKDKPREICNTMQPKMKGVPGNNWGYNKHYDGKHRSAKEVVELLEDARNMNANLLLNVGPQADGSFPKADIQSLREAGTMI